MNQVPLQNRTLPALVALATIAALSLTACEVKKTEDGEMPKVNVEGGKLPKYDVKPADVNIEMKKKEITVPEVKVVTPKEKREAGNTESSDQKPAEAPQPAPAQ